MKQMEIAQRRNEFLISRQAVEQDTEITSLKPNSFSSENSEFGRQKQLNKENLQKAIRTCIRKGQCRKKSSACWI
jgi:hypothetical protein